MLYVIDTTLEFYYVLLYDILHHNIRNHSNKEIVLHIVCIGFQTIHVSDRIICLLLPTSGSASFHSILSLNRILYLYLYNLNILSRIFEKKLSVCTAAGLFLYCCNKTWQKKQSNKNNIRFSWQMNNLSQ